LGKCEDFASNFQPWAIYVNCVAIDLTVVLHHSIFDNCRTYVGHRNGTITVVLVTCTALCGRH